MSNEKLKENNVDPKYEKSIENFYKTIENTIEDYHKTVSHFQIKFTNSNKSFMDRFLQDKKIFEKNLESSAMNNYMFQITSNLISEMTKTLEFQSQNFKKSVEESENFMKVWNDGMENTLELWKNMFESNQFFKSEKDKT
ncbi:hypothetical protein [Nitrosopumilus sp.]|uniref:hypothetical protein n=1 Tax=Nitrosopumilus sp. TaxID=2024843 RepID=UPI003B5C05B3